ncbi:TetR family transcriptional regulator [Mycolicibacterium sp.]|uniref:TetR/AcrR family transcriptional regulator n=1 Tax=Mycolicibacterium sp. TaxID=2320850 RepID=UPI001A2F14CB|nr:TetR family transcriptional regulator [Mycolicibacterium sp.]MBJ7340952.1 TetR family transcriptional regulator [Mycolicibacterium sp.]
MPQPAVVQLAGLRERKKAYTRRLLIDMAVELCVKQGYENTTIEQIAEAVEVSPRTFSRYFASKDAVFIAVIDELSQEITAELDAQPSGLGPIEALRAAHVSVLTRVAQRRPVAGLTAERIVLILQVVYSSDALRQAATDYRNPAAMEALARHMGVAPDDRRLELAVTLFTTTIVSACQDVAASDPDVELGPDFVLKRMDEALGDLVRFATELQMP